MEITGFRKLRLGSAWRGLVLVVGLLAANVGLADSAAYELKYNADGVLTGVSGTIPVGETVTISNGCVSIGNAALYKWYNQSVTNIVKVVIPASVTNIGYEAFSLCENLATIDYKGDKLNCVTGGNAFYGTKAFWLTYDFGILTGYQGSCPKDVVIDDGCDIIDGYAFAYWRGEQDDSTNLVNLTIPASVTNIGYEAFAYCENLEKIDYLGNKLDVTTEWYAFYGTKAFWPVYQNGVLSYFEGTCPKEVSVDEGCGIIGYQAFSPSYWYSASSTNLVKITLPASVTNIGNYAFYNCSNLTTIVCNGDQRKIEVPSGYYTFYNAGAFWPVWGMADNETNVLKRFYGSVPSKLEIPADTERIDAYAFDYRAYRYNDGCSQYAGERAYESLSNLTAVTIPASVKAIDRKAFNACPNLSAVTFEGNKYEIAFEKDVFEDTQYFHMWISLGEGEGNGKVLRDIDGPCPETVEIPEGVVEIAGDAFARYSGALGNHASVTNITKVVIPSTVKWIDDNAFNGCENLKEVVYTGRTAVDGNVADIKYGDNVFAGTQCYRLVYNDDGDAVVGFEGICPETITFKDGVKSIDDCAFDNSNPSVTNLVAITVPEGFESFGSEAFYGCENLAKVNFSGDIRDISFDDSTFDGAKVYMPLYDDYGFYGFSGTCPANVVIPDHIQYIDDGAFSFDGGANPSVTNMVSLTLPETLYSIGGYAFRGCENLKEVRLPKNVRYVGNCAFENCTQLAKVTCDATQEITADYRDGYDQELSVSATAFDNTLFRNGEIVTDFGFNDDDVRTNRAEYVEALGAYQREIHVVQLGGIALGYYGALTQAWNNAGLTVTNWNYKLEIPEGVVEIEQNAFAGLPITEVTLPASLKAINWAAFENCTPLAKTTGGENLVCVASDAFNGTRLRRGDVWFDEYRMDVMDDEALMELWTAIRKGETNIIVSVGNIVLGAVDDALIAWGTPEFKDASGKSIWDYTLEIPAGTRVINAGAFEDIEGITAVTLPESLKVIDESAFNGCSNLKTVTGDVADLQYLGEYAFSGTPYLNGDTEYDSKNLEDANQKGLELIVLDGYVVGRRGSLAEAYDDNGDLLEGWKYELVIPEGIRGIADGVFAGLPITSIKIPNSMETIGASAFQNCAYVESLDLGEGVLSIGDYAFRNVGTDVDSRSQMTRLVLPASLTSLGYDAFADFARLRFVNDVPGLYTGSAFDVEPGECDMYWALTMNDEGILTRAQAKTSDLADLDERFYEREGDVYWEKLSGRKNCLVKCNNGVLAIPEGVKSISATFGSYDTAPFTTVILPSSLEYIGNEVFLGCYELETVRGGMNVIYVGENAFAETKFLKGQVWYDRRIAQTLKDDSEEYKAYANGYEPVVWNGFLLGFRGWLEEKYEKSNRDWVYDKETEDWEYKGSYELVIPEGVTALAEGVDFDDVEDIVTSLVIPGSFKEVDDTFGLWNLRSVTFGEGVEEIEEFAFAWCDYLKSVAFPESLLYVDRFAFYNCDELASVTVGSRDTVIDSTAFLCNYEDDLNEFSGLNVRTLCLNTNLMSIAFAQKGFELVGWQVAANAEAPAPYWVAGSLDASNFGDYEDALKAFDVSYWKDGWLWSYAIAPIIKHTELYSKDTEPFTAEAAETFNAYVRDESGNIVGTITVKTQKTNRNGEVKATATVQLLGAKKATVKGSVDLATGVFASGELNVKLTANGLSGKYAGYDVVGAQNKFASKDAADKATAKAVIAQWKGNYTMSYADEKGVNTVTLSVGNSGKVTVKATLAEGATVSTSSQLTIGEEACVIPVAVEKAGNKLAFVAWLKNDGFEVEGLEGAVLGWAGDINAEAAFTVDAEALAKVIGDNTYAALFPAGVLVTSNGKKWTVAHGIKPGELGNLASLKLSYTAKTGTFKGTFKAYFDKNGKQSYKTVTVSGVVVDGVGYASAYIKKVGAAAAWIK